jgi:hypothetical protein
MCRHDDQLVKDVVCVYKPVREIFGVFSFAVTLVQPVESFWVNLVFSSFQLSIKTSFFSQVKVDSFDKTSTNYYRNGLIHFKENLCNWNGNENNVLLQLLPFLKAPFEQFVQKCPYKVILV